MLSEVPMGVVVIAPVKRHPELPPLRHEELPPPSGS
jgi:hypothetical protein